LPAKLDFSSKAKDGSDQEGLESKCRIKEKIAHHAEEKEPVARLKRKAEAEPESSLSRSKCRKRLDGEYRKPKQKKKKDAKALMEGVRFAGIGFST
jgi:hypothetical protein